MVAESSSTSRHGGGFSLAELLITIAIAALVLTVVVPGFATLLQNNRLTAAHNDLVSALHLARSEAISRMDEVTACRSTGGTACDGTHWEDGWTVFHDADGDGVVDAGADTVIRVWAAQPHAITLRSNVGGRITFDGRGATINPSTLTVCDTRDESDDADAREKHASAIVISRVGRIRNAVDEDSPLDGIVDNGSGNNVSCP